MLNQFRRARNIKRYNRIISVFARHGFGAFLVSIQADHYLPLSPGIFKQKVQTDCVTAGEHFRMALEELGPAFIKLGQILSTRPDIFPPEYLHELTKLQEHVTPSPWEEVVRTLRDEYCCEPDELFASIDVEPLGSASLSQVHAAVLKDGTPVVLKVQRANIMPTIASDLDILVELAQLAQHSPWGQLYNPVEIVSHFSFTLYNELDYRREGLNADRFRVNFKNNDHAYIPKVYWDYCTQRVLCLERMHGLKIDDSENLQAAGYDLHEVALCATNMFVQEIMEDGFFHADPHPGNFFILPHDKKPGNQLGKEVPEKSTASGDGVLIGAMDFGMVGYLSQTERANMLQFYTYAAKGDARSIAEHLQRIGAVSQHVDLISMERDLDRLLNQYRGVPLQHIQTRRVMEDLMQIAFRYRITLPADIWLLFKTVTMLDGLARQLDPKFEVFAAFGRPLQRIYMEQHLPWVWGPAMLSDLESLAFAMRDMPAIAEGILRGIQRGELPFSITMGADKHTLDRVDRVSTRLSLSILIAAFILGLSLLLPVSSGNHVALVLVVAGFVFSVGLGVWMVFSILRSGK